MSLPSTEPYTIAKAFFEEMYNHDSNFQEPSNNVQMPNEIEPDLHEDSESEDHPQQNDDDTPPTGEDSPLDSKVSPKFLSGSST
jgi:hypothetical protein